MTAPRIGLFVTCLVDLVRPKIGFAAVKLLEAAGCTVEVPLAQTCCGQPAYNSGDMRTACALARRLVALFEPYDFVVAPSGSCAGMLKRHVPGLLAGEPEFAARAAALGDKTYELVQFLVGMRGMTIAPGAFHGTAAYHDSCSCLRELGVSAEPRALLGSMDGLTLKEPADKESCCGFGGLFSVKYGDISTHIADRKLDHIKATGANILLGADLGCLMHLAGRASRRGDDLRVRHIAEALAGLGDGPAIGEPDNAA